MPELATEGLTQCRAPLHETPAPHSSDPPPPFRRTASFPSLRRPPFRRSGASFPWQCRLLSVATGGQTRCCQPSFARWHIGSDPLPPPFPPPFPPPVSLPCAAPLRHQSHRQSERIQPQRMPQNGYLTAKQRDIFFKTANYANVADIRLFENCAHSVAS